MKFSIGYNHDIKLLDLLNVYEDNIEAIYFPIPEQYLGSGRDIPQNSSYPNEIPELINKCASLNIKSQLLLNATCEGKSGLEKKLFSKIIDYIQRLKSLGLGSVIVTNPVYISEIKKQIKGITIESSVNCYVKTVEHAWYLKDLGVDILTIDRDINRNIPLIKEIKKKTGLKIRILLNEGCLRNCPFRNMHYNYLSHGGPNHNRLIDNIFRSKFCIKIYLKNPAKVFSIPFIPPEALKYYANFIDYYKLSTRVFPTPRIESCLKAYINQDFNGNLLKILDSPGLSYFSFINYNELKKNNFFERIIKCNNNCDGCNYCSKLVHEAVITDSYFLAPSHPIRIKESENAIKIYKRSLETFPFEGTIYLGLARAYFNLKHYEEAIKNTNKAIELDYEEEDIHLLLGFSYEKIKQDKKAINELNKAEELNPEEPQINFSLYKCYRNIGQIEQANKELEKGVVKFKRSKQMSAS